jgi:hypothetical protein
MSSITNKNNVDYYNDYVGGVNNYYLYYYLIIIRTV